MKKTTPIPKNHAFIYDVERVGSSIWAVHVKWASSRLKIKDFTLDLLEMTEQGHIAVGKGYAIVLGLSKPRLSVDDLLPLHIHNRTLSNS